MGFNITNVIIVSFFCFFTSCRPLGPSKIKLVDQFQLNKDKPDEWSLSCKLGCKQYPDLQSVKHVRWNKKVIIVKNLSSRGYDKIIQWYIIYSKEHDLKCCTYGTVIGPIDSLGVEDFILNNNITDYKLLNF